MTKAEAIRLAWKIENYWRRKGYSVRAAVVREEKDPNDIDRVYYYTVRSDLVRGLPAGGISNATAKEIAREVHL